MKEEKKLRKEKEIELTQKALNKKPMTTEELEEYQKYKTKEVIDKIFKTLGAAVAILLFIVSFDFFFEGSLLGLIFDPESYNRYWDVIYRGENMFFDDWLLIGEWIGVFIITIVQFILCGGIAAVLIFYIKDLIDIFRDFFTRTGKVTKEVAVSIKKAVVNENSSETKKAKRKKKLFDDQNTSDLIDVNDEDLDKLLTLPPEIGKKRSEKNIE